ncbi:tyrosine-type recombinase/integrase [Streptomyces lavendulae]|uniref:tyrosine-type recombinase/integrase n=1 Tax=Streptomyces lavendulae TaxID=1914 RepID=UPI0025538B4B|nr:tyrosine-type recombinase/integrase [Streptomyces lavendulae]
MRLASLRSEPSDADLCRSPRQAAAPEQLPPPVLRALNATGLGDVHFHDLRHTGNTLAATGGATTRELMQRMGHSSVRAALIYQHLVNGRDHAIAAHVDEQIRKVRPTEPGKPSGT